MQKSSDPDSFLAHSVFIFFGETLLLRVIVREFQGPAEQTIKINILSNGLLRDCRLARLQKISPANFDRRDSYDLRDAVHVPLHRKQALRRAESAKSSVRWRIRRYCFRSNAYARPKIRSARVDRAARKDHGRQCCVCAAVDG